MKPGITAMAAALLLAAGCGGTRPVYFRPAGPPVEQLSTFYPEQVLRVPPDGTSPAEVRVAVRGDVFGGGQPQQMVLHVRLVISNMSGSAILLRPEHLHARCLDKVLAVERMTVDKRRMPVALVQPGRAAMVRLVFGAQRWEPARGPFEVIFSMRYSTGGSAGAAEMVFVQIMPGELTPPPAWSGVIIFDW